MTNKYLILVHLGQSVGQGSQPGDGRLRDQLLEEHSAFILISKKMLILAKSLVNDHFLLVSHASLFLPIFPFSRTEGDGTDGRKSSCKEHKLLHYS